MKKKKKSGKNRKKTNDYEEVLIYFEKLNESLKMLDSVSKSLKTTAKVLRGPIQTNLSKTNKNMKVTAEIIENIKSTQKELNIPRCSIIDAKDLDLV